MRWLTHSFDLVPLAFPAPKLQAPPPAPTAPAQDPDALRKQDQAADDERASRGTVGRDSDILTSPLGATLSDASLAKKTLGA